MVERRKRLKEVYEYLRAHSGIHTQKDFAESIKYSRVYISAAMNGVDRYLTDKLFTNICEVFPVFNINYLLSGTGTLINEEPEERPVERQAEERPVSVLDLYAALIKDVETLRTQLSTELEAIRKEREQQHQLTTLLHDCLFRLQSLRDGVQGIPQMAAEDP